MNELIKINYEDEKPTISGRELHEALEIDTEYAKWFTRMCEYGFSEGKSYSTILTNRSDGLPGKKKTDHAISISMAKEICMLQRSAKGKEFREYFIKCEEAWNSPEKIIERAMKIAYQRAIEAERCIFVLSEEMDLNEYWTVSKFNWIMDMGWDIEDRKNIGKLLTAYCIARAIKIRKCEIDDERFGTVNSYPISVWKSFMEYA